MLEVGRERRAQAPISRRSSISSRRTPNTCPSPMPVSTPRPSPLESAMFRASISRSRRPFVFLSAAGDSLCRVFACGSPACDRVYEVNYFNVIPAIVFFFFFFFCLARSYCSSARWARWSRCASTLSPGTRSTRTRRKPSGQWSAQSRPADQDGTGSTMARTHPHASGFPGWDEELHSRLDDVGILRVGQQVLVRVVQQPPLPRVVVHERVSGNPPEAIPGDSSRTV